MMRHLLLFILLLHAGTACERDTPRVELVVFAASSLTEAFQALETRFEEAHPEIDLRLVFSGSQVLRLQIEQGAPADVLATANAMHMDALLEAGLVSSQTPFARNALTLIVPPHNPSGITRLQDLSRARRLVIGTRHVPVGQYARRVLENARATLGDSHVDAIEARVVSEEPNARLVRAKIALGEADAALVYRSDAVVSDDVVAIPIPEALNVEADYHIGAIAGSRHAREAAAFIEFARSPTGQSILAQHGFEGHRD